MLERLPLLVSTIAYSLSVLLANWLSTRYGMQEVGLGFTASAGTFAAGAALLSRDFVHRHGGPWIALAAVGLGIAASYVLADPFIATASAVAFAAAELLDLLVFSGLHDRLGFPQAAFISNLVSAPVDSVLFLWIAPAPIFVVTADAVAGQMVGKIVWATLLPLALYLLWTTYRYDQRTRRAPMA